MVGFFFGFFLFLFLGLMGKEELEMWKGEKNPKAVGLIYSDTKFDVGRSKSNFYTEKLTQTR